MSSKEKEFWNACRDGKLEKVKELSLQIDDINWGNPNVFDYTGLQISCALGNEEIVEYLISHPKINVNKEDKNGATPLFWACSAGKEEIVKILLKDERVNVNKEDKDGSTPLFIACYNGKEEIVKILFASGREIDTTKKTFPGNNAWNNTTAAEIARKEHDYYDNGEWKKGSFPQIAKLVDEYAKNPMEIILRLRKEMSKYLLIVQISIQQNHLQKLNNSNQKNRNNRNPFGKILWNPFVMVLPIRSN